MSVSSYTVSLNNSTPGVMLSSVIVSPCVDNVCEYLLNVSTYCQTTSSIGVAVSAKNELGAGLSSNPEYIGKSLLHVLCCRSRERNDQLIVVARPDKLWIIYNNIQKSTSLLLFISFL